MKMLFTRKKIILVSAFVLLGAVAWWQHRPFLAKYYVYRLIHADDAQSEGWEKRIIALDEAALPALLAALDGADQRACDNLEFALVGLAHTSGADDSRALLDKLIDRFEAWPAPAKNCALQCTVALLAKAPRGQPPTTVTRLAGDLLTLALKDDALRVGALHLAAELVTSVPHGQWLDICRDLAQKSLTAEAAEIRVAAIQLLLRPPLRQDNELLAKVVPLLKDPTASVRKTALLALGSAPAVVADEELLPLLHDSDDEVQNLCELALRSRGLGENHILLARYISDDQPAARLRVLELLRQTHDLEPGVWLRRLCQDPAPAVRAAAIRAAAGQSQVDLSGYLTDMARQDPSITVRQIAAHYLNHGRALTGN